MTNKKIIAGLLTGLAAGAVLSLFASSEKFSSAKNCRFSKKLVKKGNHFADDLKEKFNEFIDRLDDKFQGILK